MEKKIFSSPDWLDYGIRESLSPDIAPIKMSVFESAFLAGLLEKAKPLNVLELGVSAGGTTCLILDALRKCAPAAKLSSVDLFERWFDDPALKTGYLVLAREKTPAQDWKLYTGKYLPQIIHELPQPIDFAIIDTVHFLPGELLDVLVLLPYMKPDGILLFHDINLYAIGYEWMANGLATKVIFDALPGEKILVRDDSSSLLPNIGAIRINHDSLKYVENLFLSLSLPWHYLIRPEEFDIYYQCYARLYGEEFAQYFYLAYEQNKFIFAKRENNVLMHDQSQSRKIFLQNKRNFSCFASEYEFTPASTSLRENIKEKLKERYPNSYNKILPVLRIGYRMAKRLNLV